MEDLIRVLEQSAYNNGHKKVLTIGHLLNLLKIAQKRQANREEKAAEKLWNDLQQDPNE